MDTMVEPAVVEEILDMEWGMFQSVQSIDGPMACQQDRRTFEIMRSSQVRSWTAEIAASYLDDLTGAQAAGRNLMAEKYARMMEHTAPSEFRQIAPSLPPLAEEAVSLVEQLSGLSVGWMEELAERYPHVGAQGRPIHARDDSTYTTSFETYNRGELSTYGAKTLRLLLDHFVGLAAAGTNPAEVILADTVAQYGFASIEQAEAAAKARAERRTDG
jgi:hypothetical protein